MPSKDNEKIKASRRKCYHKHKVAYCLKIVERKKRIRQWSDDYKKNKACIRCGESHPACLEFHHRDPHLKQFEISKGVANGYSIKLIETEMAKCDILCANCHKKLHSTQSAA